MARYFIYLSYNGANYCGWQVQPNGMTVQEKIEHALSLLFKIEMPIVGAGRTDAGVHARTMVAHFDVAQEIEDTAWLVERLNRILPKDIAIKKIVKVKGDAHARFDAVSRMYRYYILNEKDPFLIDTHYKIHGSLDLEKMNACANVLFEYEDFTSFSKLHTDVKTNNCQIMQAEWERKGSEYIFTIRANRFLRNMVRAIVGTLLDAGRGKLDENGMRQIIEEKQRGSAGISVPGNALFLEDVEYPNTIFEK